MISLNKKIGILVLLSIFVINKFAAQNINSSNSLVNANNDNIINKTISNFITSKDSSIVLPKLKVGGAFRINYSWKDYDNLNQDRFGDFGFEVFRLNIDVDYKDIFISAEQRWYTEFRAIRFAYFGYHINENLDAIIGIHQVPFGIAPYSSHSFWFNATYYVGFEDDYDAGIKFIYNKKDWNIQAAFYKNAEFANPARYDRYSFDLVTDETQKNEEINQLNLRLVYKWDIVNNLLMKLGLSVEYGQIYNQITTKKGERHGVGLHNDIHYKKWNIQMQWIDYEFNPKNPEGVSNETVLFGAFKFPFLVSSKAEIYTFNAAREININGKYIDKIKLYGNLSMVNPKNNYGSPSKQIVIGTTVIKRGLYAYFDYIFGQNMWFSGGPGVGLKHEDDKDWNSRLNINLGYYF